MDAKETTIYQAVLIAGAVLGVIITYFIIAIMRQQRRHRELYKTKLEAEINAIEKERARVAADLHDDLGPILTAARFKLGSLELIPADDAKTVEDTIGYIDNTLDHIRQIANDLMPNTLLRDGPVAAVEEFIDHSSSISTLKISFTETNIPELTQTQAIHVYRIIQEIVHNTLKHASATRLAIEFSYSKNKFVIATADDGVGFNYGAAVMKAKCRGLGNLKSRSELLGGELHINSKANAGTSYLVEFELPVKCHMHGSE